jgi:hypothetical protein
MASEIPKFKIPMPRIADFKGLRHRKFPNSKSRCPELLISKAYGIGNSQIQNPDALNSRFPWSMASDTPKFKIPMPRIADFKGLWHRKLQNSKSRCPKCQIPLAYGIGNSQIQNPDALSPVN